jgi:hypothetical protein
MNQMTYCTKTNMFFAFFFFFFFPQTKSEPSKNFKQYDLKISLISERERELLAVETTPVEKRTPVERNKTEARSETWRNTKSKRHLPQYTHKNARERESWRVLVFISPETDSVTKVAGDTNTPTRERGSVCRLFQRERESTVTGGNWGEITNKMPYREREILLLGWRKKASESQRSLDRDSRQSCWRTNTPTRERERTVRCRKESGSAGRLF